MDFQEVWGITGHSLLIMLGTAFVVGFMMGTRLGGGLKFFLLLGFGVAVYYYLQVYGAPVSRDDVGL